MQTLALARQNLASLGQKLRLFSAFCLALPFVLLAVFNWLAASRGVSVELWLPLLLQLAILIASLVLLFLAHRHHMPCADEMPTPRAYILPLLLLALSAASLSYLAALSYTELFTIINAPTSLASVSGVFSSLFSYVTFLRAAVLFPFALLVVGLLLYPSLPLLRAVFAKRWLVAGCLFAWYVLFRINISNVGAFHYYIQPTVNDAVYEPLFGIVRGIRSDEWLVNLPLAVSTDFAGFGEFNDILRGTSNYNLPATGLQLSWAALSNPLNLGYYLFGSAFGASFFWCGFLFLSIMLSSEFAYIISGKRRTVALLAVAFIAFSPFNLWWSICSQIIGMLGILVCTYYCFTFRKFWQRCLCMFGVAMFGAYFICRLYPAWQVPVVYLMAPLFVWVFIDRWKKVKEFRAREWIAAGVAVVFMASIVLAYLSGISEYSAAIMDTVYPGARFEVGGYSLPKIFSFIQTLQMPFRDVVVGSNNSEAGTFFSLYPLPTLYAIYVLVRQLLAWRRDRSRRPDLLNICLLIPTVFFTIYCTVGFPDWLAKITLMSYSTPFRAVDFLGFADLLLLLCHVGRSDEYRLPMPLVSLAAVAVIVNSLYHSSVMCPGYLQFPYVLLVSLFAMLCALAWFAKMEAGTLQRLTAAVALAALCMGLTVLPVNSGIDALTEKPAAQKVQEMVAADPDAKWIGYGNIITGQYVVANGGPCITSTNYMPNMELWQKLDPTGQYNEVYNRYSHITLEFCDGETTFELLSPDHMRLSLSYGDIKLTEAKYIFSMSPISEESPVIDLEMLYAYGNIYIYQIHTLGS